MTAAFTGGDAVSAYARLIQRTLLSLGARGRIFAASVQPEQRGRALPLHRLGHLSRKGDGIIYHHSIASAAIDEVAAAAGPKMLVYHNVTPGAFVRRDCPQLADELDAGRRCLPRLASMFDCALTVSRFNADELRAAGFERVRVLPIPIDAIAMQRVPRRKVIDDRDGPMFLFVGRLLRHKCPHELIGWFQTSLLREVPNARLVIAGSFDARFAAYNRALIAAAEASGGRVQLLGGVDDVTLVNLFRRADVFVSFSEHEGFMVPLVEAMATDTAVLAHEIPAVAETLGGAGVQFKEKRWNVLTMFARALIDDAALRTGVLTRQRERLAAFHPTKFQTGFAGVLDAWLETVT